MKNIINLFIVLVISVSTYAEPVDTIDAALVYRIDIKKEIGSTTWLYTKHGFEEARAKNADVILIHMNTYGGQVVFADSIRTKILNSSIPVYVFIDNNAASAGALISIACDGIYMRPGASIGAATVVSQGGEQMPDKYQSYMRSTIRATAEAHGKDTVIQNGDTAFVWKRDPRIAEAMVDASIYVEGISDTGKVLTFTSNEAITNGYCEGLADNIDEVVRKYLKYEHYELATYKPTSIINAKGFLMNPVFQGILIMLIIGGLYFELQSPGIGFPLGIAIAAAIVYLAPLYIEGLAEHWEIILFLVGVVLVMLEVFVIPGFGVAGVSGIILVVAGLTLSMVDRITLQPGEFNALPLMAAFATVTISMVTGLLGSIWLTSKFWGKGPFDRLSLKADQKNEEGFVGVDMSLKGLVGKSGVAHTVLRPSGMIMIEGELYDAVAEYGMIEKGSAVIVDKFETGQLYVSQN